MTHLLPYQNPSEYDAKLMKNTVAIPAPAYKAYLQVFAAASYKHYVYFAA